MDGAIIGAFNVAIYCVVVVLVAFILVWVLVKVGWPPSPDMMKYGRILVILLCVAAVVSWLLSLIGVSPYLGPHFLR